MKRIKCDVLVVGAGPAGASAALFLSEKDLKTVLVEKKANIDEPLRCAEFIPLNMLHLFQEKILSDPHAVTAMKTHVASKEIASTKIKGAVIDRPLLLKKILGTFQQNGGTFLSACSFVLSREAALLRPRGTVSLLFDKKRGRYMEIESKIIVCCEGPFSKIKKWLQIPQSDVMPALSQNIAQKASDTESTHVFFERYIKAGYGWLFPKKDSINIGIGAESKDILGLFERFKKDLIRAGLIDGSAPIRKTGTGLLPISAMMAEPVRAKIVFAGDAANLCNQITGAGIYNAVLSAKICASAISKAIRKDRQAYLSEIKKGYDATFSKSIQRAYEKRRLFSERFDAQKEQDIEDLIRQCWISSKQYYL